MLPRSVHVVWTNNLPCVLDSEKNLRRTFAPVLCQFHDELSIAVFRSHKTTIVHRVQYENI